MRTVSLQDCADLADGVYINKYQIGAWKRIPRLELTLGSSSFDDSGYFSAPYVRDHDMILVFRGTALNISIWDDGFMAPVTTRAIASKVAKEFIALYTRISASRESSEALASGLWAALEANKKLKAKIQDWGVNMMPVEYIGAAKNALRIAAQYAFEHGFHIRCVVGHSLGGAIAQCTSEFGGSQGLPAVPAVSINGPCMGNIQGTKKGNGAGVLTLNSKYDPLSNITGMAGNESHALPKRRIVLETVIPRVPPAPDPSQYGLDWQEGNWAITAALLETEKQGRFLKEFGTWLKDSLGPALGAGHSSAKICEALASPQGSVRGATRLDTFFPNQSR
jgi:hypothetical protein